MKTDLIEIFQTIRASLQPYATLGFDNRTNSEQLFDLWSNKNVKINDVDVNEVFFCSVAIDDAVVSVRVFPDDSSSDLENLLAPELNKTRNEEGALEIKELDENRLAQIEDVIAASYKLFKDRGWVE
jgi:hypothetical protein